MEIGGKVFVESKVVQFLLRSGVNSPVSEKVFTTIIMYCSYRAQIFLPNKKIVCYNTRTFMHIQHVHNLCSQKWAAQVCEKTCLYRKVQSCALNSDSGEVSQTGRQRMVPLGFQRRDGVGVISAVPSSPLLGGWGEGLSGRVTDRMAPTVSWLVNIIGFQRHANRTGSPQDETQRERLTRERERD